MSRSIKVEGSELVYHRPAIGSHTPASTTRYFILGVRPGGFVTGEASLMDDSGQRWRTGCAYVNVKGTFGDGVDRMVCWKVGEADARDGRAVYHMQPQRRPVGSDAEWENYKSAFSLHLGTTYGPHEFKPGALSHLRWYPEEQPAYEWRGRVHVWVSEFSGRPHTVYPDGRVVADN
ncbi:hypothetical protein [Streptomyces sp. NBC_01760]|uniref:hypothetical protein n=1 Tax=Streptomyces sp. NBC_01760 TaxID=2975931 RepID=UPI002DD956B4|nr:hypothetical protein [Streptomyces sp. NBC_01760]WSC72222.1 hypothetical protein OG807_29150 [Streptomyces sp. NBC_01760]